MNIETQARVINYNVAWPKVQYTPESLRSNSAPKKLGWEDTLKLLEGWSKYPEISIDGMNGTGKSWLSKHLNREYVKINDLEPRVTKGSEYNYDPIRSMEYMMLQQLTNGENIVWDRSPYSNLIFYFVHHLMAAYKDEMIPANLQEVLPILNTMAVNVNLIGTLSYIHEIKRIPTLFFVCRDLNIVGLAIGSRNSLNDRWNSKEYNYQMAQFHCYTYMAQILNMPCIDLMDFIEADVSLEDMQAKVKQLIDIESQKEYRLVGPDTEASRCLKERLEMFGSDNLLFFNYSKK